MNFAQVLIGLEAKEGDVLTDSSSFFWKVTKHGIQAVQDCAMYIPGNVLAHIPAPNGLRKLVKKKVKKAQWAWKVFQESGCFPKDYISSKLMSVDEIKAFVKMANEDAFEVKIYKLEGTEIEEEIDVHS